MRILLVEDEQTLGGVLKTGLEEHGYAVDLAEDGESGIAFVETEMYDLVILDVMLPDLDGFSVCRRLRSGVHNMPVLMLTALNSEDNRVKGLDSGADDYLTQPFDPRELLARARPAAARSPFSRFCTAGGKSRAGYAQPRSAALATGASS
jgi:DNA-binding response OmpR family regulator